MSVPENDGMVFAVAVSWSMLNIWRCFWWESQCCRCSKDLNVESMLCLRLQARCLSGDEDIAISQGKQRLRPFGCFNKLIANLDAKGFGRARNSFAWFCWSLHVGCLWQCALVIMN